MLGRGEVLVGRSPSCDLILPSESVSRRHARIYREGVFHVIEDLGSTNGTSVNGTESAVGKPLRLVHDAQVLVGTVALRVHHVEGTREEIALRFAPGLHETDHVERGDRRNALMTGTFTRDVLHEVVQLLELHAHTGVLRIEGPAGAGMLRFRDGIVVEARLGAVTGERAVRELLAQSSGEYAFHAFAPDRAGVTAPGGSIRVRALSVILALRHRQQAADEGLSDDAEGGRTRRLPRSGLGAILPPDE